MRRLPIILTISGLILLVLSKFPTQAITGPSISLSPAQITTNVGQEFTVNVNLNTNDLAAGASDIVLRYPSSYIKYKSIINGNFFPQISNVQTNEANDKLRFTAYTPTLGETRKGASVIATLTFEVTQKGSVDISFYCANGSTTQTTVVDGNGENILNCSSLQITKLTLNVALPPQATATPTKKPTPTKSSAKSTPTPTMGVTPITSAISPIATPTSTDQTPLLEEPTTPKPPSILMRNIGLGLLALSLLIIIISLIRRKNNQVNLPPTYTSTQTPPTPTQVFTSSNTSTPPPPPQPPQA